MDSTMDDDSGQSKTRGVDHYSLGYKIGPNDDLICSSGFDKHYSSQQYCVNHPPIRETGIIEKLLHSCGFIQCCKRQARLFFNFSQFSGNTENMKIGDPVEFELQYDRHTGKPIVSTVLRGTRAGGEIKEKGDNTGKKSHDNVRESFLPAKDDIEGSALLTGDAISLQKATNQRGTFGACHSCLQNPAQPGKYHRLVGSIKENFDFITKGDLVLRDDVEYFIKTGKEHYKECTAPQPDEKTPQAVSSSTEVPLLSTGQSRAKKCEMCESTEIREELLKRKVESHKQKVEELNKKKIGFCVRRMQEYHQLLPHSSSRQQLYEGSTAQHCQQLYGGSTAQHWSVSRKEVQNVRKYRNQGLLATQLHDVPGENAESTLKMPGSNGLNIMPEKENGLMATPNFMTFLAKMLLNAESVVPPDAS
ncbi:unnamed protein product [Spodoptera exigua]|nr:unnamed protein product [Spodoptera exigua]